MGIEIFKGDCLEIMPQLKAKSIDLVLVDPPYGTTKCGWDVVIPFEEMWASIERLTLPNTPILIFGTEPFSSLLRISNLKNFKYDWVWDKIKSTGFLNAKKQPLRGHEIISVFYKKQCLYQPIKTQGHPRKVSNKSGKDDRKQSDVYSSYGLSAYDSTERYPRSIQTFSSDVQKSSQHPTQKPVALLEYFIKTYSKEGDTVLDFTMGRGSTGLACLNTNRKFIGIERDPIQFNNAKELLCQ